MPKYRDAKITALHETLIKAKRQAQELFEDAAKVFCLDIYGEHKACTAAFLHDKYHGACACGGVYDPSPIDNYLDWVINWADEIAILMEIQKVNPELLKGRTERIAQLQGIEAATMGKMGKKRG